jgi:D-alanyl-lipoteichoic acid acyltransferase DltB (MBOAT superfamily)
MLFNSIEFFVFLAVVLSVYRQLGLRGQNLFLLLSSYYFYGAWDPRFLVLIWISTVVDFYCGLKIDKASDKREKKKFLLVSMITNLGILGFFKYFNFFTESLLEVASTFGWTISAPALHIILPVGISFYTFQTMSYTLEIYRGGAKPTRNFLNFALFVAYFPQLVAGPIERASLLLPRIEAPRVLSYATFSRGWVLILVGLFKKVALSDGVANSVNTAFSNASNLSALDIALASFLFAVQIYGDFSGYTDIARGVSKLFGIDLMFNFNVPYLASNPSEFWKRWHISLSSWLRDNLYIPLGGNRGSEYRTYRNLIITMLLGGLWHGAAWNFVIWGLYHGILLAIHRVLSRLLPLKLPRIISIPCFFAFTCYGWLLFRAESLEQVVVMTSGLSKIDFQLQTELPRPNFAALLGLPLLIFLDAYQYFSGTSRFYESWPRFARCFLYSILIFLIIMGTSNEASQFIYFQF